MKRDRKTSSEADGAILCAKATSKVQIVGCTIFTRRRGRRKEEENSHSNLYDNTFAFFWRFIIRFTLKTFTLTLFKNIT
jgi:hypothetical protein